MISFNNPRFYGPIGAIAKAICGDGDDPALFEQALRLAESRFILRCVRYERCSPSNVSGIAGPSRSRKETTGLSWARLDFMR
jgi:hypothetical protein